MKINQFLLATAVAVGMVATGCDSKPDKEEVAEQSLVGYYNIITDNTTGQKTVEEGVGYDITYNYNTQRAEIRISGLKLPDGVAYPTLRTEALKWNVSGLWKNIYSDGVQTSATNYGLAPILNNFTFNLLDQWYDETSYSAYTQISFDIDDRYHVLSLSKSIPSFGNTVVKVGTGSYTFTTDRTVYVIELQPGKDVCNLSINEFALDDGISMMAVAITEIPVVIGETGNITMAQASNTASVVGAADPSQTNMPVSDLEFKLDKGILTGHYTIVYNNVTYTVTVQ